MVEFKTEKVTDRITRIYGVCTEMCYLVEGDDRAALIDTCSGYGHLRPVVDSLLPEGKELIVLLTHGHTDHAMGSGEFTDCEIYLNPEDEYIYGPHGDYDFRHEGFALADEGVVITEDDYIPTVPFSTFLPLHAGDTFDLGGEEIEMYGCPGHTKGTLCMLFKEERILLLGDACNTFTFLHENYSVSIDTYEQSLKNIKEETAGKYDRVLALHGNGESPIDIIDQNIQICEDIKAGNTADIPMEFRGSKGLIAKEPQEGVDAGNIVYSKEQIWEDGSLIAEWESAHES